MDGKLGITCCRLQGERCCHRKLLDGTQLVYAGPWSALFNSMCDPVTGLNENDSKSHDKSRSFDHVSSIPLVQTRAKVSIEITADHFALEHMPLLLLSILRQQEETRESIVK
jgi:hypothetical protein